MSNQLVQRQSAALSGTYSDVERVTVMLDQAAATCHLVSPAPSCGMLPEGCSVALSTVQIDPVAETYDVVAKGGGGGDDGGDDGGKDGGRGGRRGLSKSALDRIAAAAGVSWDPHLSRRLDDGRDPHYCLWKAVGYVRQFDGTTLCVQGTKEVDLREGSAQVEGMRERYRDALDKFDRKVWKYPPKDPSAQIREQRLHVVSLAETKARLRATRSLGIRTAYSAEELRKPFVVARLMFTGQSNDPELRRAFALKRADAMLGGAHALYGNPQPTPLALAAPISAPPVGSSVEDEEPSAPVAPPPPPQPAPPARAAAPEALPPQASPPAPPATAAAPQTAARPAPRPTPGPARPAHGFVMPFGDHKDRPIEEVPDQALSKMADYLDRQITQNKSRYPDKDRRLLEAMRDEMDRRVEAENSRAPSNVDPHGDDEIPF